MAIFMVSRQKWKCFPSVCPSKGGNFTFSSINCMDTFHQIKKKNKAAKQELKKMPRLQNKNLTFFKK